jgi:hypothetical protein
MTIKRPMAVELKGRGKGSVKKELGGKPAQR